MRAEKEMKRPAEVGPLNEPKSNNFTTSKHRVRSSATSCGLSQVASTTRLPISVGGGHE